MPATNHESNRVASSSGGTSQTAVITLLEVRVTTYHNLHKKYTRAKGGRKLNQKAVLA